ncbi:MAG: type II toxin-antitoxin system ParD family antitoxin [Candidatus Melainabacteria bacterium]|nr:type II toxin-antitoxin system ParD family antitoxin [Candidatus Melainabacteria bacterium]
MNVSLTPELEDFVNAKVKTGLYNSASEVVRASLRLLKKHDDLEALQIEELKAKIKSSIEQMDSGQGVSGAKVRKRLEERRTGKRSV